MSLTLEQEALYPTSHLSHSIFYISFLLFLLFVLLCARVSTCAEARGLLSELVLSFHLSLGTDD